MKNLVIGAVLAALPASIALLFIEVPFILMVFCAFLLALLWITFVIFQRSISIAGGLSLFLTLSTFFTMESFLRSAPEDMIVQEARRAPILVPPDRGNEVFRKNGFRGRRPCKICPDNLVRIVTMGGSSTFGTPLYYSEDTYSAELQRLLDRRRQGENYEVLNGGIPGYGIMQIVDSLESEVLKFKPDIVTVCAWFNDSSSLPSWYGFADKSDKESYEQIRFFRAIEKIPGFKSIYASRTFAFFRYQILRLVAQFGSSEEGKQKAKGKSKKGRSKPRMTPAEFEWGLEQVVALGKKHNFLPVLVYEAVNRTPQRDKAIKGARYYEVIDKIAAKYDLPLVDTLKTLAKHRDEWMFYDFIHPNKPGHQLVAESIYDALFRKPLPESARVFMQERGIDFSLPDTQKNYSFQVKSADLSGNALRFKAATPFSDQEKRLTMYVNGRKETEFSKVKSSFTEFVYDFPVDATRPPLLDLEFRIDAQSLATKAELGSSGLVVPSHILAKSGGKNSGWMQAIEIDGASYASNFDGYAVVVLGARSGQVREIKRFNLLNKSSDSAAILNFMGELDRFSEEGEQPIIIITLKTDGWENADREILSEAFRRIGGSGYTPLQYESFILVGAPGLPPGRAVELHGEELLQFEAGKEIAADKLFSMDMLYPAG